MDVTRIRIRKCLQGFLWKDTKSHMSHFYAFLVGRIPQKPIATAPKRTHKTKKTNSSIFGYSSGLMGCLALFSCSA
eukprot:2488146-Amphidinium_carterae.1